jgi:hypothetical protein
MQRTVDINTSYEKLPLVNPEAPKVESRRSKAGKTPSEESIKQDNEDAEKIMSTIEMDGCMTPDIKIEANEKYLIETMPGEAQNQSSKNAGMGGLRKPHYTLLFVLDNKMVFQAACCLPLRVIAANLDGNTVSGKVLYSTHSDNEGGKLVYEFQGEGSELIIDVKRGDSTRAQRLIFRI